MALAAGDFHLPGLAVGYIAGLFPLGAGRGAMGVQFLPGQRRIQGRHVFGREAVELFHHVVEFAFQGVDAGHLDRLAVEERAWARATVRSASAVVRLRLQPGCLANRISR